MPQMPPFVRVKAARPAGLALPALVTALGLAMLPGCKPPARTEAPPEVTVAESSELLDGFEGPAHSVWAFDSADDEADAAYAADGATQGKRALRLTLRGKGAKGKIQLRREIELDLSKAAALSVDVTSPAAGLQVALALKGDPGDVYQEAQPVELKSGLNRAVHFPLRAPYWKNAASGWAFGAPPVNLAGVRRVMLLFFTGETSSGSVSIDNLRVEGDPGAAAAVQRAWRPKILLHSPLRACAQYAPQEFGLVFQASYSNVFDPRDIAVGLHVETPGGRTLEIPGFFAGLSRIQLPPSGDTVAPVPLWGPFAEPAEKETKEQGKEKAAAEPEAVPVWAVRFAPSEVGQYRAQFWVRNPQGEERSPLQVFVVAPQDPQVAPPGIRGGAVRIARHDPRQFERQDGTPFFWLGQNVAWATDFKPYLEKVAAYGGNTCRVWLCPWGLNLERKTEPGVYDLAVARRIDELMRTAEATGVRIVFCFTFHGATASFWHESPYAAANGGPCLRPEDFWTDAPARRQFKSLLDYAVARWGASPALLSWELINEVDLAKYERPGDAAGWVREMAGYLKHTDPHGHLVTASVTRASFEEDLWDDPNVDVVCAHGYGADVPAVLYEAAKARGARAKPFVLAEFGGGWEPAADQPDAQGLRLQAALWLSACSPSAGAALPWWWDTHIQAHELHGRFAALARFLKGDDRRGRYGRWVKRDVGSAQVHGAMDEAGARLYVFRPDWVRAPESRRGKVLQAPASLSLRGVLDGPYRVEYWDADAGKPVQELSVDAKGGVLALTLPALEAPLGVKVDRRERTEPSLGP